MLYALYTLLQYLGRRNRRWNHVVCVPNLRVENRHHSQLPIGRCIMQRTRLLCSIAPR